MMRRKRADTCTVVSNMLLRQGYLWRNDYVVDVDEVNNELILLELR